MSSKHNQMLRLIEAGLLKPQGLDEALSVTGLQPSTTQWQKFIQQLLLVLGLLSLAFSLMYFIAYNWQELGRFAKFGMVEAFILFALVGYWRFSDHELIGKLCLFVASIGLGVLMALFGQAYQTGADPWQLFANWALLIIPWTVLAQFSVQWMLWIVLVNLSALLYFIVFRGLLGLAFLGNQEVSWLLFGLNLVFLGAWEIAKLRYQYLNQSWATRFLVTAVGVLITSLMIDEIFSSSGMPGAVILAWLAWAGVGFYIYLKVVPDLFVLAGISLSINIIIICGFAVLIGGVDTLIFLALITIGLGTTTAVGLRNIHRRLNDEY